MGNDFEHIMPDVLSLQEVDMLDDFVDCLGQLGYAMAVSLPKMMHCVI